MDSIKQCDLIVTENCSLQCKMCHIWKHKRDDEKVSFREYADFMSSLRDFAGKDMQIQFVGGEPLLKKGITEMISYAAKQGFSTTMTTNGFLIDKKMADMLVETGLNTIGFSLESLNEEKHDFLRGVAGVHRRIMEALDYFGAHSALQLFISSIIMRNNLGGIVDLAEWAEKNERISFIYFQAIMQPFAMPESDDWYRDDACRSLWPDAEKAEVLLEDLISLKRRGYKIANHPGQLEVFKSYFKDPNLFIKRTKCNLGYTSFTVLPDGNIFLCLSMEPIGNIKTDRIDKVWSSQKAQNLRQQIAECRRNCKLMINCFFEEEADKSYGDGEQ
ncbi:radical SAM protein [Candidatus Omnitrophota bacterium]